MAVDINGDGLIALGGTSTTQGSVRLAEDTDNGTNYVELTAPALLASNVTVTMPNADGTLINTDPGTASNVLTSNGTAWVSQAISAGGDYIMAAYTSPATWTKPAGLKAVKVTVIGGGGTGGPATSNWPGGIIAAGGGGGGSAILYLDAPAIPGPVSVTAGPGTNSFGALASATAGGTGGASAINCAGGISAIGAGGTAGAGSSGTINFSGERGSPGGYTGSPSYGVLGSGLGGSSFMGARGITNVAGSLYGGGGGGRFVPGAGGTAAGFAGANGIVIVEEFY